MENDLDRRELEESMNGSLNPDTTTSKPNAGDGRSTIEPLIRAEPELNPPMNRRWRENA